MTVKSWCRWFRYAPLAVACRNTSARYTRLVLLALCAPSFDKTIVNRFVCTNPAGGARKKHLRKQVLFSTKFAFGEWNMASPCEIASLWNICFANVNGRISFHIATKEQYFTMCDSTLFHIRRKPNISLAIPPILWYTNSRKAVGTWNSINTYIFPCPLRF